MADDERKDVTNGDGRPADGYTDLPPLQFKKCAQCGELLRRGERKVHAGTCRTAWRSWMRAQQRRRARRR